MTVPAILLDRRNWSELKPLLVGKLTEANFVGFDIETNDADAHDGIKQYRGNNTAKVFDINRTIVCGCSLYVDGDTESYYLNLAHADAENRLPWPEIREVLDARNPNAHWICHNAPFELTMMAKSLGYELDNVICTLQLAVSAYGADEYDFNVFVNAGLGDIRLLLGQAARLFQDYEPGSPMTTQQADLLAKVVGKNSKAKHSWNGFVDEIAYGYSLKKAVKSFFGYQMTTFKECLGGREHMGQLTGEEVCAYGADDAYWAVRLFHRLLQYLAANNPKATRTFFDQENPMVPVYAEIWKTGMRVNTEAIAYRRNLERSNCATTLRQLKADIRELLPFQPNPYVPLLENDDWYRKNWKSYRDRIEKWVALPDHEDDREQCLQISGAVSNAWAAETGARKPTGPNFTHYMMMRTILYDLLRQKMILADGKTASDNEARGRMLERLRKKEGAETAIRIVTAINELAGIEQRMKLYLTPYTQLADPDTGRLYPVVSSQLVTRRMASSTPNGMQFAKRGVSTYVRGFFEGDAPDHLMVSLDWRQIELVLIGEFSGDPEFAKAYGQLPYRDLHLGAAADILAAVHDVEVSEEMFASLNQMPDDVRSPFGFPLLDQSGKELTPHEAYKYNRGNAGGKGANFGYWYSGTLNSVAEARGVNSDLMWKMTEKYRARFPIGEEWRLDVIEFGKEHGFIELPDGHRRVKLEATQQWINLIRERFEAYEDQGIIRFGNEVIRKINRRARNQIVNALIQGSCATLAKRSIVRILKRIKEEGFDANFKMPIHDELLFSVRWDQVVSFLHMAKSIMCDHPEIISKLKMDTSASIGVTFEPWHATGAPLGQIEIDEAPKIECLPDETLGKPLNDDQIWSTIDWLRNQHMRQAA